MINQQELTISKGTTQIITDNDSKNVGLPAINDKLGYIRQSEFYKLINTEI